MAALKLFISHSSRLRRCDADDEQAQRNWQLLQETCALLQATYPETLEILVDYQGLKPGDDWERRLNEWLAECHAAIIFFSQRAIKKSPWVKKEAAILSWRAAIDPGFRIFPVLLAQQTTQHDLDQDPDYRTLRITRTQCVEGVSTAAEIVAGIKEKLGDLPASRCTRQTPFEELLGIVARTIAKDADEETLDALWQKALPETQPHSPHLQPVQRFADGLARDLLNRGKESLQRFRAVLDNWHPGPTRERAEHLLKYVRALWVEADAAGSLALVPSHGQCLALNGRLVGRSDNEQDLNHYFTLTRFLERAWPGTNDFDIFPVSNLESGEAIWRQFREEYSHRNGRPQAQMLDKVLADDKRRLIVLLQTSDLAVTLSEPRLLGEIHAVKQPYPSLIFVLHVGEQMPEDLPDDLQAVRPEVDTDDEALQCAAEHQAWQLIDRKYGR